MKHIVVLMVVCVCFATSIDSSQAKRASRNGAKTQIQAIGGSNTSALVYQDLLNRKAFLGDQISALSMDINSTSRSKAKKLAKQIDLLVDDLASVERSLSAFPASVTNPSSVSTDATADAAFRAELEATAALRIGQSDPFAGQLSLDPELDRMYRSYLSANNNNVPSVDAQRSSGDAVSLPQGTVFRVMIALSKTRLSGSAFGSLDDVMEQRMPNGGYVYYQGSYATQAQAQASCNRILAANHFRDAFVVAMVGTKRVQIN